MTMTLFQIRNTKTGLLSKGGMYPQFDKRGKIWRAIGQVKCHLSQLCDRAKKAKVYEDCEIVVLETVERDRVKVKDL